MYDIYVFIYIYFLYNSHIIIVIIDVGETPLWGYCLFTQYNTGVSCSIFLYIRWHIRYYYFHIYIYIYGMF